MRWTLALLAGFASLAIGLAAICRKHRSPASWCFLAGIALLGVTEVLEGQILLSANVEEAGKKLGQAWVWKSFLPGIWILFSLIYCRGDRRERLRAWRWPLLAAWVVPPLLTITGSASLATVDIAAPGEIQELVLTPRGKGVALALMVAFIAVLANLEHTFRGAVGVSRWRVKYLFIGLVLIFGVKVYVLAQSMVRSVFDPTMADVESISLILGCGLLAVGYLRNAFNEFDIYPSRAVLRGSLTVLLASLYLVGVGIVTQTLSLLVKDTGFPGHFLGALAGIAGLLILLLSDQVRSGLEGFVSRHFRRPRHDLRKVWTEVTKCTSNQVDTGPLCDGAIRLVSETFHVLTVRLFLYEPGEGSLVLKASSAEPGGKGDAGTVRLGEEASCFEAACVDGRPFDLERCIGGWADALKRANPSKFPHGGPRRVVPMAGGGGILGVLVLADRVNGAAFTREEIDLLSCISDQISAVLLNCRLSENLTRAREMEAFQTMSAFFVHDLKNAANSLNLMLRNVPLHFDDPQFRADTLAGIGSIADRINHLVVRLGSLKGEAEIHPRPTELNSLVSCVVANLEPQLEGMDVRLDLAPLPELQLDPDLIRSVVANLVINAKEALGKDGEIRISTTATNRRVVLTVSDNGKGMDAAFVRSSLFQPFRSTKSKGLGIGMFQCKTIIAGHRGDITVESGENRGTEVRVILPVLEDIERIS